VLLRDYAITPDVFDETSYTHPAACDQALRYLKEVLLNEGIVRDLRNGEWRSVFANNARPWHIRGKELLKKLGQQNRLVAFAPALADPPRCDIDWCQEAVETHHTVPFAGGVIVTERVKTAFQREPLVGRIDRLGSAPWWASRGSSVSVKRHIREYLAQLAPILRHANSFMFIDPYLDPAKRRYREFPELIRAAGGRDPAPLIELHRCAYEGSGEARSCPLEGDREYFRRRFRNSLREVVRAAGVKVRVFIWKQRLHDRYLITDLIGISLANGFDTGDSFDETSWSRLSRDHRDKIQRSFDASARFGDLCEPPFEIE